MGRSEKRSNSKGLRRIRQGGGKEESEKCSDGGREKIVLEDRGLNVTNYGTSLAVQWLRLRAPNARGMDSIPDQGTKIPHIMWPSPQKKVSNSAGRSKKGLKVSISSVNVEVTCTNCFGRLVGSK